MTFLIIILFFILSFLFWNFFFFVFGHFLFRIGCFKIGHYLVGSSIAGDFGFCKKTRQWLSDNCPKSHSCDNCKIWTCASYDKKIE